MMMLDPHKAVMAIMKRRKAGSATPMKSELPSKDSDGELDPRHMAAEEVISAMHSKSPHHLMEALGNFHDLHKMHREKEDSRDMESDPPEL